jgi:rhodanese-related sulfurtransferase
MLANKKPRVKNNAYNLLLKQLLSAKVPSVNVDEICNIENNIIFLDAREAEEYNVSHIAKAINIGFKNFDLKALSNIKKNDSIIIYCSVGYRSEKICTQLISNGFTNVYNLYGGIFEWINNKMEVVNKEGESVKIVHGFSPVWGVWVQHAIKIYS